MKINKSVSEVMEICAAHNWLDNCPEEVKAMLKERIVEKADTREIATIIILTSTNAKEDEVLYSLKNKRKITYKSAIEALETVLRYVRQDELTDDYFNLRMETLIDTFSLYTREEEE